MRLLNTSIATFCFAGLSLALGASTVQAASGTLVDFDFSSSPFTTLPPTQDATYTLAFAAGSNFNSGNYSGSGNLFARGTGSTAMAYSSFVADAESVVDGGTGSYFDFSLTAVEGQALSLSSFSVEVGAQRLDSSGSTIGAFTVSYFLRSSVDGYESNLATLNRYIGEGTGATGNNYATMQADLSSNTAFQNIASDTEVTFRVYSVLSTGTASAYQVMRMDNVTIDGVTAIPEPQTVGLLFGALVIGVVLLRRRNN